MFPLTRRVPFAAVFGWLALASHPLLRLVMLIGVALATVVLIVLSVVAIVVDIVLTPIRLLL
jgi:hypothetical protein